MPRRLRDSERAAGTGDAESRAAGDRAREEQPGRADPDAPRFAPRTSRPQREKKSARPEPTPVERALRLLSARARTAQELVRALERAKVPAEQRAAALARMRELGYIDDASLAESRAKRLVGKGDAPRMAARRLQQQGVSAEAAQAAVTEAAGGQSEDELAAQALAKRLRGRPVRDERERRRLMRALVQHGHRPASVAKALKLEMDSVDASGEIDDEVE